MEIAALTVSALGVLAGLVTLSFVLRNEFRERRKSPPVVWGFHRYAEATVDGVPCEAAELVQYGKAPTHMHHYATVGCRLLLKEGYRVRRFVKGEDTMPLFLTDVDKNNAWLVVAHSPRDDRRFTYFHSVDLEPTSEAFMDAFDARYERWEKERKSLRGRLERLRWRFTRGSIVRPVGPMGYPWARLRSDRPHKWTEADVLRIMSLVDDQGGSTFRPY